MTIESHPKYLDAVLELLGLEGAKDVPTPSVPARKEKLMTGELLSPAETTVYRQCVGGLFHYTQDRADAQYEVKASGRSNRWKCERCGCNRWSKRKHSHSRLKSQDNCADLGTKTLAAGTLSLLRNLNGLVDKSAMDSAPCGVQAVTISSGESRMLRATALEVLERTLYEIARNNRITSRGEKVIRGLEPEQLYAMCANSLQGWGRWKSYLSNSKDTAGIATNGDMSVPTARNASRAPSRRVLRQQPLLTMMETSQP